MAIMARWRMPPENSCGYMSTRVAACGMPTRSSISMARARAAFLDMSRWIRTISAIWRPTVCTGLRAVSGSWKIMAISPPRTSRMRWSDAAEQVLPVPQDPGAAHHRRWGGEQAQDAHGRHRLARARLAHHGEHLAPVDVEADPADGLDVAVLGVEVDAEVPDRQEHLSGERHRQSFTSSASRRPSPTSRKPEHGEDDGHGREEQQVGSGGEVALRRWQIMSPSDGVRLLHAHPEEAQRGLGQHRGTDAHRHQHDDGLDHVGQDVAPHDPASPARRPPGPPRRTRTAWPAGTRPAPTRAVVSQEVSARVMITAPTPSPITAMKAKARTR